jgi:hypothetical protein
MSSSCTSTHVDVDDDDPSCVFNAKRQQQPALVRTDRRNTFQKKKRKKIEKLKLF